MKNLIVPTDFSSNAENAVEYALYLADKMLGTVHLFHAFRIDIPLSEDVTQNMLRQWEDEEEERVKKDMKELSERLKEKTGCDPDIKLIAKHGSLPRCIEKLTQKGAYDMVVIGTKGSGDIKNRFFGSNTSDVLDVSNIPVLCVPQQAKFHYPNNIVYATEYQYADIEAIKKLTDIASVFDANLTLLHVSDIADKAEQELYQDRYKQMAEKHFTYDKISYKVFRGGNVVETINKYVEDEHVHLLVMSTRTRSVWQSLFDRSLTKHMTYHTRVPLLAYKHANSGYEED